MTAQEIEDRVAVLLREIDRAHTHPRSRVAADYPWVYNPKTRRNTDAIRKKIAELRRNQPDGTETQDAN